MEQPLASPAGPSLQSLLICTNSFQLTGNFSRRTKYTMKKNNIKANKKNLRTVTKKIMAHQAVYYDSHAAFFVQQTHTSHHLYKIKD